MTLRHLCRTVRVEEMTMTMAKMKTWMMRFVPALAFVAIGLPIIGHGRKW